MKAKEKYKGICVTDLDGTLLNLEHQVSKQDLAALHRLRSEKICRVAATGRSLYSLKKVIGRDDPFDYVIFSTGAGIMNWQTEQIILARHINAKLAEEAFKKLLKLRCDFMFHAPIPENHRFLGVTGQDLPDFERRIGLYRDYCTLWDSSREIPREEGTQFLVVADEKEEHLYLKLINLLAPLQVIRTTSPLDHLSLWLEVFAPDVSKGSAVEYLLMLLGLTTKDLMVAGNDYNDYDMLKLCSQAYVTDNAPTALKRQFRTVADHNHSGFSQAVTQWLGSDL